MDIRQDLRFPTSSKAAVAGRLRLVRIELFGEDGGHDLADRLGIPFRTWLNYESGVTIPGEILLLFLETAGIEPLWLLRGVGPRYRETATEARGIAQN